MFAVVVTGLPGSGKTTLAEPLAGSLNLPLIAQADIKELRADHLGLGPVAENYGRAAAHLLLGLAAEAPKVVLKSFFWPGLSEPDLLALHRPLVQVHCRCDAALARARFEERVHRHQPRVEVLAHRLGVRHPVHRRVQDGMNATVLQTQLHELVEVPGPRRSHVEAHPPGWSCRRLPATRRHDQPGTDLYSLGMGVVVDDTGGNGMPVVCLPMLGMSRAATALAFGPALAGGGSREVYLDLPGHGDAPGQGAADSQTILDTVCDWLQRHLQRPALLAGASYGAYLAAGIARQRPDLVEGLLLVCPGLRVGAHERDLPDQEPPAAEQGWLEAAPAELHGHLDRALGHRTRAVVEVVLQALAAGGPGDEAYQDALTDGPGYALADQDAELLFDGPVTIVAGRNDRVVGYADQFRALQPYPRGTYCVVDAAGHYLPWEQPELFRALTQDWLQRRDT